MSPLVSLIELSPSFVCVNDNFVHGSGPLDEWLGRGGSPIVSRSVFFVVLILLLNLVFVFEGREVVFVGAVVRSVSLVVELLVLNDHGLFVASAD